MMTTKTAKPAAGTAPLWHEMRRCDFDASEPLTLFDIEGGATAPVKTDKCGTPDMFTGASRTAC